MDNNITSEDNIFSQEYASDSSTNSPSTKEDSIREIDSSINHIIISDQDYSINKPWRRIIKAVIKNG